MTDFSSKSLSQLAAFMVNLDRVWNAIAKPMGLVCVLHIGRMANTPSRGILVQP